MHAISYETTIWLMLFFSLEILQKYLTKMYSVYFVALQCSSNIYLITVFYIQITFNTRELQIAYNDAHLMYYSSHPHNIVLLSMLVSVI